MMKYFYLTGEGTTAGPETLEELRAMVGRGAIHLGTLVVPAGGEDWTPLARVLRFFYGDNSGGTVGPVPFSELDRLHQIAALPAEAWVMEEGGSEWKALAGVLTAGGVPVLKPALAAAIPRTATGAFRPPPAGNGHITSHHTPNPYAAPHAPVGRTVVRYRPTGGIGRLQFIVFSLLLQLLFFGGLFAVGAGLFREGGFTREQIDLVIDRHLAAVVVMVVIQGIASIVLSVLRIRNIGWPWYYWFLQMVPLVNIWFAIALLAYPPGYARHGRFDTASRVIAGIVAGFIVIGIVLSMVFGKRIEEELEKNSKKSPPVVPGLIIPTAFRPGH